MSGRLEKTRMTSLAELLYVPCCPVALSCVAAALNVLGPLASATLTPLSTGTDSRGTGREAIFAFDG